jgi:hypothetical protein
MTTAGRIWETGCLAAVLVVAVLVAYGAWWDCRERRRARAAVQRGLETLAPCQPWNADAAADLLTCEAIGALPVFDPERTDR